MIGCDLFEYRKKSNKKNLCLKMEEFFFKSFFDLLHRKVLENFHFTSQIFSFFFSLNFFFCISMFVVSAAFCLISKNINWMQTKLYEVICTIPARNIFINFFMTMWQTLKMWSLLELLKNMYFFFFIIYAFGVKEVKYVKKNRDMKWKLLI